MDLVYLAQPYSHPDPQVKEERYHQSCIAAARLMGAGMAVFSPIAHSHSIEVHGMDKVESGDFWLQQDFAVLKHCKAMIILMLPGWNKSHGVAEETGFAKDHNIPIYLMEPTMNADFKVEDFIDAEDASSAAVVAAIDGSLDDEPAEFIDLGEIVPGIEDLLRQKKQEVIY